MGDAGFRAPGVLEPERVIDQLDHVAVGVVDVGVVLAGVLPASLIGVRAADAMTSRGEPIKYLTIAGRTTAWVPTIQV